MHPLIEIEVGQAIASLNFIHSKSGEKMQKSLVLLVSILLFLGCQTTSSNDSASDFEQFLESSYQKELALSPIMMSYLGIKKDYDKWDDISEEALKEGYELRKSLLEELKKYDLSKLSGQNRLSYLLYRKHLEQELEAYKYRHYVFAVNQLFGLHTMLPTLMINTHSVTEKQDALDYISRLHAMKTFFDQLITALKARDKMGIIPPDFVYDKVIDDSQNLLKGYPFEKGDKQSVIYEDFMKKLSKLDLAEAKKKQLSRQCEEALLNSFAPAYRQLIDFMSEQKARAPKVVGAWTMPDGAAYYRHALGSITTTDLSPKDIHELGLKEVDRIHKEMNTIKTKLGFKGSLQEFFTYVNESPKAFFPNTPEGKAAFLKESQDIISAIRPKLKKVFGMMPKSELVVKAVEPYREASAGIAFYQAPSLDSSRPGIYYVNLYDTSQVPRFELEALAYHEGIPGHHFERSISLELSNLPLFRRTARFTAYIEGWGLYSELVPKEIGFYQDPLSDFGRLSMELLRAVRLVADTGLHWKRWTKEEAIQYMMKVTPASRAEVTKSVERYLVMPGQATAYKIGMLKILQLRKLAKEELGEKFQLKDFHDQILKNGPLPLDLLEQELKEWIKTQKAKAA